MSKQIEKTVTRELELSWVYLHKIGTKCCLRNMIKLGNPSREQDREQKENGLQTLEHHASTALDSTSNGIVTPENIHPYSVNGSYSIFGVYYGSIHARPGSEGYADLSFRQYVSLGRPKVLRVTTKRTIENAERRK